MQAARRGTHRGRSDREHGGRAIAELRGLRGFESGAGRAGEKCRGRGKDSGITANVVLPSTIDTPANRAGHAARRIFRAG